MEHNIYFSIAIPAYKYLFLKETIKSVLAQTFDNWELIILNDASPENLKEIVSEFSYDSRIKYYENTENIGAVDVVKNWNRCLEISQGDFLICMGDDDLLSPNCLEIYVDYITKLPDYDLYHGATEIIDEKGNFFRYQEGRPLTESVFAMAWQRLNRKREQFIGDFLFRTKKLKEVGGFFYQPLAWASDDITSYLCALDKGVVNTSEFIFKYRCNRYTISNTGQLQYKLMAIHNESQWFKANLLEEKPKNDVEKNYQMLIRDNLDTLITKKIIYTIAESCISRFYNTIISLIKFRKHIHTSFTVCLKGFCLGIVYKLNSIK